MSDKRKLIQLFQDGLRSKDYVTLKSALQLDESLGGLLALKDYQKLFDPIIKKKKMRQAEERLGSLWSQLSSEWDDSVDIGFSNYESDGEWGKPFEKLWRSWLDYVDSEMDEILYISKERFFYIELIEDENLW